MVRGIGTGREPHCQEGGEVTPEEESFALKCGREDRNMEYKHDWQDMQEDGWRYKPGPYGGHYRVYRGDDE